VWVCLFGFFVLCAVILIVSMAHGLCGWLVGLANGLVCVVGIRYLSSPLCYLCLIFFFFYFVFIFIRNREYVMLCYIVRLVLREIDSVCNLQPYLRS